VFELIALHPWLGAGPLHYAHYGADLRGGAHPHNWALQIAAEWGVPACLCLVAAIARAVLGLVRTAQVIPAEDVPSHTVLAAMLVSALATLADGLVSGVLVMPQAQLLVAIYIGCAVGWASRFRQREPGQKRQPRASNAIGTVLLLAAAAGLAGVTLPDLGPRLRGEPLDQGAAALNPDKQWPRLWLAGYF
jgi:O-antigen ligase